MPAVKLVTTKDLQRAFDVSHMAIIAWRQGSATRDPLPIIMQGRNVRFSVPTVKRWAKRYDVPIVNPEALDNPLPAARPGPKHVSEVA